VVVVITAAPFGAPPTPTVDPTAQHRDASTQSNAWSELTGTGRATAAKVPSQGDPGAMVAVVAVGEVPLPHPQASRATAVAAATPGCMSRRGRCRPADRMAERQVDDAPLGVSPGMLTDARAVSGP
jgi:hypothetical protein